jgi:hypothetical protein
MALPRVLATQRAARCERNGIGLTRMRKQRARYKGLLAHAYNAILEIRVNKRFDARVDGDVGAACVRSERREAERNHAGDCKNFANCHGDLLFEGLQELICIQYADGGECGFEMDQTGAPRLRRRNRARKELLIRGSKGAIRRQETPTGTE